MRLSGAMVVVLTCAIAGCGEAGAAGSNSATPTAAAQLLVTPLNSELLVGVDRLSFALFDGAHQPVNGAQATLTVESGGKALESRPLEGIGAQYGNIPVYVGTARFPTVGAVTFVVRATLSNGRSVTAQASGTVRDQSRELPVGYPVPALKQPILGDPGVTIRAIDSGVPPDPWHTATIADGLAQHRPMVLYFGQPGFCKSNTCGPTVAVLQELCQSYCDRFLFEHIETHYPAGPDETAKGNPAFDAFGFQTEPWIYFITAGGKIADRFEGPATVAELRTAADGTLAGRVPAVDIAVG